MITNILIAVAVLGGLGLIFGLILAISSKIFAVKEDERLAPLTEALPGANCGGCGFSGCAAYASAVIDGTAQVGLCSVGGNESAQKMAEIMGLDEVPEAVRNVAFVRCTGLGHDTTKYIYSGIDDCLAATRLPGGGSIACSFGCLGYGSCSKACPYDAIHVENFVAKVDEEKCKGCSICINTCPRSLITLVPYGDKTVVRCANHSKGNLTRFVCPIGCIGCTLCTKVCPTGAITVEDNLARIDYAKCTHCGACVEKCPRKLISIGNGKVAID
jgi:Na+-translocating ferredoxin:NAD+ oxidoreductase RNF subunit RnfB